MPTLKVITFAIRISQRYVEIRKGVFLSNAKNITENNENPPLYKRNSG